MKEMMSELKISLAKEDMLRRIFLIEISDDNFDEILKISSDFDEISKNHKLLSDIKNTINTKNTDEARYEYNRLFVGPRRPKAVPYESTYFDYKNMFGTQTMDVRAYYQSVGLKIDNGLFDKIPDDHIGYEFQFLYYLSYLALDKLSQNELDAVYEILELKAEFINAHPSKWFDKFTQAIINESGFEIFCSLASFLNEYLQNEMDKLKKFLAKNK